MVVSELIGLGDQIELTGKVPSHKVLSLLVAHHAEHVRPGLLKTKNRFYSKGSEQCIKRGFFPPGYAELEPSASYLASSSSGASAFFVPEQTGLLFKLLKFSNFVSCPLGAKEERRARNPEVKGSSPIENVFF